MELNKNVHNDDWRAWLWRWLRNTIFFKIFNKISNLNRYLLRRQWSPLRCIQLLCRIFVCIIPCYHDYHHDEPHHWFSFGWHPENCWKCRIQKSFNAGESFYQKLSFVFFNHDVCTYMCNQVEERIFRNILYQKGWLKTTLGRETVLIVNYTRTGSNLEY